MQSFMRIGSLVLVLCLMAGVANAREYLPDFSDLAAEHSTTVVRVEAEVSADQQRRQMEQWEREMPDLFRHFFGDQMPPMPEQRPRNSQGSGFIISDDGYVVTNHHVIADAENIRVRTSDHRIFYAEVVGTDEQSDIALIKVDASDLPYVQMGDSDELNVGEWVLAIGAPFGMDYSVTAGIVSAKGRSLGERYVPFIQSDVAINPGNSGGPLFNRNGEVIGINSQIYTRSGGFMGMSFAIPSNLVVDIVDQLRETGSVSRGWLGIAMDDSFNDDPELAESFGLDRVVGALVVQVYDGTPAQDAGLLPGDLILEYDGRLVTRFSDLAPMVGATRPGTEVDLLVLRNGEEITVPLEVGELPQDEQTVVGQAQPEPDQEAGNVLNVRVRELTTDEARALGDGGVFVTDVLPGPAEEAGLREGDIITMIHGQFVTTVEDFEATVSSLPEGRRIAMRIVRDGTTRFISIGLT